MFSHAGQLAVELVDAVTETSGRELLCVLLLLLQHLLVVLLLCLGEVVLHWYVVRARVHIGDSSRS